MACSSIQTSSSSHTKFFEVFVSFRGADTRNGFTGHLFAALQRKGVVAFKDDQKIRKGEPLEPELLQAIEGSRVFIVVFSKDYASSTWCLKELTKIAETGRPVLHIFYDVTPSEVRKQSGKFEKAFAEHEKRFKDDLEMVQKWREALEKIANCCGWDAQNKQEHEVIENVVDKVINILLDHNQNLSFEDDLVDMHSRVPQVEELLDLDANEVVRVVGICGMGGIGKTTLATALFDKISPQFDACCFIDDVSKIYREFGPMGAQKQLLCQALNQGNMEINNLSQGTMLVRTRLCHLKALIVLDNVNQVEQLEKLALHPRYLGAGSRVIIISRDRHILRNYGVNEVYNVQLLGVDSALQLLCKKAFKSDDIVKGYEKLMDEVLDYVGGLPLAIKVLGSFLFDRDIYQWRSALSRLKENPNKDIMAVLRISFDGLEENEKEIFLDIACFFAYLSHTKEVEKHLAISGFHPDIGMEILREKSLISYTHWGGIHMHDLLIKLGRSIVQEKSPKEPRKWSRLWDYEDFHNVMMENKEAEILEAIDIKQHPSQFREETVKVDALSKMNHLKLLKLKNVNFSGILNYLSNELRYLSWNKYPFTSLPSTFHPDQLVELIFPYSNIKQLWKGIKCLPNLRVLDLSYSKNLIKMPDLGGIPHLKRLNLEECVEMVRIGPSIGILKELTFLNLKNCRNLLLDLNIIFGLNSLEELNLSGCSILQYSHLLKKPGETEHLEKVDKNRSAIQLSTSCAFKVLTFPFHIFSSRKPEDSIGLSLPYLPRFPCLFNLDLSFCNLLQIPESIGNLHSLVRLNLGGNKFVTLPTTIKQLFKHQYLNLEHCKQLKYLPELPTSKEESFDEYFRGIYIFDCPKLSEMEHCYRMVFSWMMQHLEVYLKSSHYWGMNIVIPGSEIPRWFSEQNVGSSIRMDLSSVKDDPNWIGVVCCAVFVAHDYPNNKFNDGWKFSFHDIAIGVHNARCHHRDSFWVPIQFKRDLVTVEFDHLLIMFFAREYLIAHLPDCKSGMLGPDTIAIKSRIPGGFHLEVKSCGYRCVFEEDLQQFKSSMMFTGNSSSRNRKLLTSD